MIHPVLIRGPTTASGRIQQESGEPENVDELYGNNGSHLHLGMKIRSFRYNKIADYNLYVRHISSTVEFEEPVIYLN